MFNSSNCEKKQYSDLSRYVSQHNLKPKAYTNKSLCKVILDDLKKKKKTDCNLSDKGCKITKSNEIDYSDKDFKYYKKILSKHVSSSMAQLLKADIKVNNINFEYYKKINDEINLECKNKNLDINLSDSKTIQKILSLIDNQQGLEYLSLIDCIVQRIFLKLGEKITSENMNIFKLSDEFSTYFSPLDVVGEGSFGKVLSSGLMGILKNDKTPIFTIKVPLKDEKKLQTQLHEVVISRILNKLIKNYSIYDYEDESGETSIEVSHHPHNFLYSFGGFYCGSKKEDLCKDNSRSSIIFLGLYEYIDGDMMEDRIKKMHFNDKIGYILLVARALQEAQDKCKFMHNDLHLNNVLLRQRHTIGSKYNPIEINFGDEYVKDVYAALTQIPLIIDYGMACAEYDNKVIKPITLDKKNELSEWFYATFDIFVFIYTIVMVLADEGYKRDAQLLTDYCLSYWFDKFKTVRGVPDKFKDLETYMYKLIDKVNEDYIMLPEWGRIGDRYYKQVMPVFKIGSCKEFETHVIKMIKKDKNLYLK